MSRLEEDGPHADVQQLLVRRRMLLLKERVERPDRSRIVRERDLHSDSIQRALDQSVNSISVYRCSVDTSVLAYLATLRALKVLGKELELNVEHEEKLLALGLLLRKHESLDAVIAFIHARAL